MAAARRRRTAYVHPVNKAFSDDAPIGARIADGVTGFMGSWKFIVIQTVIVTIWIAGNIFLLFNFDPAPFILLNLAFSTQAAYAAPLILLAGNRQSLRDRMTLAHKVVSRQTLVDAWMRGARNAHVFAPKQRFVQKARTK